jgi:hypothetical protein
MRNKIITLIIFLLSATGIFSQNNVGIGTNTPDSNAILELKATDKGILIPRMTTGQRNNMTPVLGTAQEGLLVYDNDSTKFFYWDGFIWKPVGIGATGPQGPTGPSGGPAGPTGPTGIANVQLYGVNGTSDINICSSAYTIIPGLSLTITLTDSATLDIYTCGGLQPTTNNYNAAVAIICVYNNNLVIPSAIQTHEILTFTGVIEFTNWSFATVISLPAGVYNFDVRGASMNDCYNAGANNISKSSLIIQVFY